MQSQLTHYRQLAADGQFHELLELANEEWALANEPAFLILKTLAQIHVTSNPLPPTSIHSLLDDASSLDQDSRLDVAAVHNALRHYDSALALLTPILDQHPDNSVALFRAGIASQGLGKTASSIDYFSRAIASAEGSIASNLPAYLKLIQCQGEQGDWGSAQQTLGKARAVLKRFESPSNQNAAADARLRQECDRQQLAIWVGSQHIGQAESWLERERTQPSPEQLNSAISLSIDYADLLARADRHAQAQDYLNAFVAEYPNVWSFHRKLAELAYLQGQLLPAIHHLQTAIRLVTLENDHSVSGSAISTPSDVTTHIRLALQLAEYCLFQATDLARESAQQATKHLQILPRHLVSLNDFEVLTQQCDVMLARVEIQDGETESARQRLENSLRNFPVSLSALKTLGQLQTQLGELDQAKATFEKIREINPEQSAIALLDLNVLPEDSETLKKIETLARNTSTEGQVQGGALLKLASAFERLGDFGKAFQLAKEGNEARKRLQNYDPRQHRNQCARIRYAFNRDLFEHRPDTGHPSTLPVFVVGMPRSGTTLVEQILSSHSNLFGAGELGIIPRIIQGLNRWERHTGSGRQYPDCIDDLSPEVVNGLATGILSELQAFSPSAKHIIDKLPHNFEQIGLIKFLFPQAKIISVRRDPRDIAISNYFTDFQARHAGLGYAYDLTDIGEQLADHHQMMRHWQQVFPGQIHEVHYESLIANQENETRKLLDYLGVDWEPQVMTQHQLQRPVRTASVLQVRQPLYRHALARWQKYESHLQPLIKGTNAPIRPDPITDIVTLPQPGWLAAAVTAFNDGHLDRAEHRLKKLLHHIPQHGAATYLIGLIYLRKGHLQEGIQWVETAIAICPWKEDWQKSLSDAHQQLKSNH